MAKFRKKPVEVEATQWWKNGDHPEVVRRFRHHAIPGSNHCRKCSDTMRHHGWIETLEGGHIVCPGDWIITGVKGERYPCKPDIFEATYETVDS